MAHQAHTTRRALFAAAPALAFATAALATPKGDLSARWADLQRQRAQFDAASPHDDDACDAWIDRWHRDTGDLLKAPLRSRTDAAAKLECAALMFEMGDRSDELDLAAISDVIAYLKADA